MMTKYGVSLKLAYINKGYITLNSGTIFLFFFFLFLGVFPNFGDSIMYANLKLHLQT